LAGIWLHIAKFLRFPAPLQMVYLLGGRGGATGNETLDTAEAFDWWSQAWIPLPRMSSARVVAAVTTLGRLIVVAGGYHNAAEKPLNTVEAFDPARNKWFKFPSMPTHRYGLALACVKDQLFAIGGDDGTRLCDKNEVYDKQSNAWSAVAPLPGARAGGKAESYKDRVYYVGGCTYDDQVSRAIFVYNPSIDDWTFLSNPATQEVTLLRVGRTSFAMSLLSPSSGISMFEDSDRLANEHDSKAKLVVTGGLCTDPGEDSGFRADTELIPFQECCSSTGDGAIAMLRSEQTSAAWPSVRSVPPMSAPRCGSRSVVLWQLPGQPFLPWTTRYKEWTTELDRLEPYLVVLGGDTPSDTAAWQSAPCPEPAVLDISRGRWYNQMADSQMEQPLDSHSSSDGADLNFIQTVLRMRTNRIACAMCVAQGLPSVRKTELQRSSSLDV